MLLALTYRHVMINNILLGLHYYICLTPEEEFLCVNCGYVTLLSIYG